MDLLSNSRVCGVESGSMSVVSGKLKSPAMKLVHTCGGGRCFLIVLRVEHIRFGVQCGGRWRLTNAYILVEVLTYVIRMRPGVMTVDHISCCCGIHSFCMAVSSPPCV